jgi:hypothetical protein
MEGWSNVFYTQVRNPLDTDGMGDGVGSGGRLELEVFSGDGCESSGDGGEARWDCVEKEGVCTQGLGFGVRSFRVSLRSAEEVGAACVVGAMESGGRRIAGRLGVVLLGVVVGMILL